MENKTFNKRTILIGALAGALGYALFGPVGLIIVALYYVWKAI